VHDTPEGVKPLRQVVGAWTMASLEGKVRFC
jgi:hypothetical protein